MKRFKVGDRVTYEGDPATVVSSTEAGLNGYDYLLRFDSPRAFAFDWEGHPKGTARYVFDSELVDGALYTVVQKKGQYLAATKRPDTPYTHDTAIDAAREFAKDGNEYLVLKAVASVKIPQAEPVVTTL